MVDHPTQTGAPASARQENSDDGTPGERVAKALARAGVASRREVERYIEAGRVAINGKVLTTPAVKVLPGDILTVDGMVVASAEPTRVWRYHKPNGLMTTHNDPQGRPTVFEHLPEGLPRVISIGRLDLNSEGLLLLTNDGELSRSLELPATAWVRRYRARAFGHTTQAKLDKLKDGITIEGVAYGPIDAKLDKVQGADRDNEKGAANLWITVSLSEGKNREVRRVLEHLGVKVNRLIRLAYGPFALGTLDVGSVEEVGPRVIREQLSAFIAPENLPTGDRRPGPALASTPGPGRRSSSSSTRDPGSSGEPRPKARPEAAAPEKKEYKAGWAKPKHKANPHAAPGAAKPKPSGQRQSWGEKSTFKPKVRSGAPTERVAVGERPAYGKAAGPRGARGSDRPGPPGKAFAKPAWAKDSSRPDKPRGEGAADRPAWAKSGGKARVSTNPDGPRAARKYEKAGAAPADARGDKPAWVKGPQAAAAKPRPGGPALRSSGKPQKSWSDGPRPERAPDKRSGPAGGSRPKPPTGRVYGLPQHGEAHERAPWDAPKPPSSAAKPPHRAPPKPRKPR
ncbi:MAG TPA: pseudouridine synthase [Caulobacteraceae bacterium]|jgi:23S rRNA pseudouridine2605 synthase|nr:pseudouridine synthase [Caulobacteraceae bacterium]